MRLAGAFFFMMFCSVPPPEAGATLLALRCVTGHEGETHTSAVLSAQLDHGLPVFDEDGHFDLRPLQISMFFQD